MNIVSLCFTFEWGLLVPLGSACVSVLKDVLVRSPVFLFVIKDSVQVV